MEMGSLFGALGVNDIGGSFAGAPASKRTPAAAPPSATASSLPESSYSASSRTMLEVESLRTQVSRTAPTSHPAHDTQPTSIPQPTSHAADEGDDRQGHDS